MSSYLAFLGHQPHVSIAELAARISDFTLTEKPTKSIIFFGSEAPLHAEELTTLGGTVVLAQEVREGWKKLEDLPKLIRTLVPKSRKIIFALRTHGLPRPTVHALYREIKRTLRKEGIPSRYVGNERQPAAPALLRDTGLIEGRKGCELVIVAEMEEEDPKAPPKRLWIGRTIAAQDPDPYTHRDMEKPRRDLKSGLLPPKLAQVMLNFASWLVSSSQRPIPRDRKNYKLQTTNYKLAPLTVLDPFCGTGVIPMECVLRKWNVLASDKSKRAVDATKENLEWLRKEEQIWKKDVPDCIWKHDARSPFDPTLWRGSGISGPPDVIVSETSLGPPLEERPRESDIKRMVRESEELEEAFLRNVAASLPGIPLVLTFPVWFGRSGPATLTKVWRLISKLGYLLALPPYAEPSFKGRLSLLYRRPDQWVGREIVLLKARKR